MQTKETTASKQEKICVPSPHSYYYKEEQKEDYKYNRVRYFHILVR